MEGPQVEERKEYRPTGCYDVCKTIFFLALPTGDRKGAAVLYGEPAALKQQSAKFLFCPTGVFDFRNGHACQGRKLLLRCAVLKH